MNKRAAFVALAAVAVLGPTGCTSRHTPPSAPAHSESTTRTDSASEVPTVPAPSVVASTAAASVPLTTTTMTMKADDGTTLGGTLRLSHILRPGSAEAMRGWSGLTRVPLPCETDPTRDGVFIGSISFTNQTPAFTPTLSMNVGAHASSSGYSVGFAYSDGGKCQKLDGNPLYTTISPEFTSSTWGPLPLEIVISNYFTPAKPNGQPDLLAPGMELAAFQSPGILYTITTSGGILEPFTFIGPGALLRFPQ
jgi:hypothetical protein